jgi:hypothetical protein
VRAGTGGEDCTIACWLKSGNGSFKDFFPRRGLLRPLVDRTGFRHRNQSAYGDGRAPDHISDHEPVVP